LPNVSRVQAGKRANAKSPGAKELPICSIFGVPTISKSERRSLTIVITAVFPIAI